METQVKSVSREAVEQAAAWIRQGQVVAIPTETVYGLAANAFDGEAVARIFEAKGRPQDNPLIVHIADMEALADVASDIPEAARLLAAAFWPGPLTMVLPRRQNLADAVSAGLATVGVRMPAHEAARAVIHAAGVPLAAPSANLSGSPSPTSAAHVLADMAGRIPFILDGGASPVGVESTVLSLTGVPMVLRPGFITPEDMEEVLGQPVRLSAALEAPLAKDMVPESPGMKYRHYAPKAKLTILNGNFSAYKTYVEAQEGEVFALCFEGEEKLLDVPSIAYGKEDDAASQAAGLFSALRKLDEQKATVAFARAPWAGGVGLAVRNRLLRAAGFREIQL